MKPEVELKELLLKKRLKLSTAESCTGGLVAARIVNVPGSSEYFMGGVVAYDNSIKMKVLNVSPETLLKFGAVSEETAKEMVLGVKKLMNTECAISTTGIAGPTGETPEKPVGLTYIGVSVGDRVEVFKFIFEDKDPDEVARRNNRRRKTAKKALKLLVQMLKEEK
ncbi:CinA domain protein [Desulfurobacterium thermolithotrophum DSM 11699]|uniref:CinA domain protein n=1 Tax=Desulfurobacterium thermolithotrophum (strain DSM 11699 / BSA) TaxID=868864 RepID=F0S250_DESTD|nr:CinA family protein [Desulfurobacterium thermolithotrophum]ADY72993.1 CinA domain protein [Desulfurobacterium thermolithotrophum DSM 11699]